ncbi:MAG: hypothetical protein K6G60_08735 [Lachnospiraceae bacterium]|nr:hypothetical protein [Lachnospiraceae bacterium]
MNEHEFDPLEPLKKIAAFLVVSAVSFAWAMLVLLIISFVALSHIDLPLETMVVIALGVMALFDIFYIVEKIVKNKKNNIYR